MVYQFVSSYWHCWLCPVKLCKIYLIIIDGDGDGYVSIYRKM